MKNKEQEYRMDKFLKDAYLPALHRAGIKQAGVLKPITQDTSDRLIYLFIPLRKLDQFQKLTAVLGKDKQYLTDGKDYLNAVYDDAPYTRIESILLQAFSGMPAPAVPDLTAPKSERFYELRSYESATENYAENKIKMFNKHELKIFSDLNFNAVFYGQVISGSRMPNLMYMTTFANKADRDKHWAAFGPAYKPFSSMPEYQHNVSKNVQVFLSPTDYSDF
ncbi:MAG: NIPSNAP family protein [Daejeonella sp.]